MTIMTPHLNYQDLDEALSQEEWQMADEVTLQIMLDAVDRSRAGWLDQAAIARMPCAVLHQIDQRWLRYSSGRFGFSTQLTLYTQEADRVAYTFSRQVEWTLTAWRPASFFKFYDWLTFSLEAPPGHLPALWFWEIPWHQSWRMGGFGTGRGAGFGDASLFDALMLRLERCRQI